MLCAYGVELPILNPVIGSCNYYKYYYKYISSNCSSGKFLLKSATTKIYTGYRVLNENITPTLLIHFPRALSADQHSNKHVFLLFLRPLLLCESIWGQPCVQYVCLYRPTNTCLYVRRVIYKGFKCLQFLKCPELLLATYCWVVLLLGKLYITVCT